MKILFCGIGKAAEQELKLQHAAVQECRANNTVILHGPTPEAAKVAQTFREALDLAKIDACAWLVSRDTVRHWLPGKVSSLPALVSTMIIVTDSPQVLLGCKDAAKVRRYEIVLVGEGSVPKPQVLPFVRRA